MYGAVGCKNVGISNWWTAMLPTLRTTGQRACSRGLQTFSDSGKDLKLSSSAQNLNAYLKC